MIGWEKSKMWSKFKFHISSPRGPFSKYLRWNKPCWRFEKAPRLVTYHISGEFKLRKKKKLLEPRVIYIWNHMNQMLGTCRLIYVISVEFFGFFESALTEPRSSAGTAVYERWHSLSVVCLGSLSLQFLTRRFCDSSSRLITFSSTLAGLLQIGNNCY